MAKILAPEDIRRGDYVTLMHVVWEIPSFFWSADASLLPPDQPVRIHFVHLEGGMPLKVKSVCLPFVLAKHPLGGIRMLDLRRQKLARLDTNFATAAWKALKKTGRKQRDRPTCGL